MGMGLIGTAVLGGLEGAGNIALREIQSQIDRDKQLALLEAHRQQNIELSGIQSGQRQAEYAARTPVDVEKETLLAPIKEASHAANAATDADEAIRTKEALPKEHADYYTAAANRLNAEADAISSGMKYKGEKPVMPNIKVEKDADGNPYMIDQNSGAIGIIRPGEPAKEGKSHWFSADEPATKAGMPTTDWNLNGRSIQLESLYPSIGRRVGDQGAPSGERPPLSAFDSSTKAAAPPPAAIAALRKNPELADSFKQHYGVDPQEYLGKSATQQPGGFKIYPVDIEAAMKDPAAYDKLSSIVGGKQTLDGIISDYSRTEMNKPAQRPATGLIASAATTAPVAASEDLGQQVDQLKVPYEEAKARLRAFGQIQIRSNPSGYAKAKQELERAKEPYERAVEAYERALGTAGKPVAGRALY